MSTTDVRAPETDMELVTRALDSMPDGITVDQAPNWIHAAVRNMNGDELLAAFAAAIVRASIRIARACR